jgi:hypothetical protein
VQLSGAGCPSAALLRDKLSPLLGNDAQLEISEAPRAAGAGARARARVDDLGAHYRVEVAGVVRELHDPQRDCRERAHVAAVFITLNLRDGDKREPAQPSGDAVPALASGIALFGEAAHAPETTGAQASASAGGRTVGGGGGVRLWLARERLRFGLGAAVLAPVALPPLRKSVAPGSAELMRAPLSLSVGYWFRAAQFQFGPSVGLALELMRMRGLAVERPQTALRVAPALTLAGEARWVVAPRWALALRLGVAALARRYELSVEPAGALARTPRFWLEAGLGIDWTLFAGKASRD